MISNDLLRKAVRVEYALLRTPLAALDERVVSRYASRAPVVHESLSRAIGVLDAAAGKLLEEESDQQAPAGAGSERESATTVQSDTDSAVATEPEPLPEPEQEEIEELAEDILEAEQEQTFAGELADDDELRRVQAELRAKHTVEKREEQS